MRNVTHCLEFENTREQKQAFLGELSDIAQVSSLIRIGEFLGRVMEIRGELRGIKCKNGERSRKEAERKKINILERKTGKRRSREGRNYK